MESSYYAQRYTIGPLFGAALMALGLPIDSVAVDANSTKWYQCCTVSGASLWPRVPNDLN